MPQYEYKTLVLDPVHEEGEHCYRWSCCTEPGTEKIHDLHHWLNRMGESGWHVAGYASDGRFGNTVILQREKPDNAPEQVAPQSMPVPQVSHSAPPPRPVDHSGAIAAIVAEVQALRRDIAQISVSPQITVTPPEVYVAPPVIHFEAMQEVMQPVLHAIREVQTISATAQFAPEAMEQLGALLESAVIQTVEAAVASRLVSHVPENPIADTETPASGRKHPWFNWSWVMGR